MKVRLYTLKQVRREDVTKKSFKKFPGSIF